MATRNECQVRQIVKSRKCRRVPVAVYTWGGITVKLCPSCNQLNATGLLNAGYRLQAKDLAELARATPPTDTFTKIGETTGRMTVALPEKKVAA